MNSDERRAFVIGQEGAALNLVGHVGSADAAERIRCHVDGFVNALIRIEGAEATSRYVFALSDRVAGGLRDGTDFRALAVAAVPKIEEPKPPARKRDYFGYWWGYFTGLFTAFAIVLLRAWR